MAILKLQRLSSFAFFMMAFISLLTGPGSSKVWAFDDASEIHHSYLNQENFLDLKSYQFHKLKEDAWYESPGGWRHTGGSLGLDLLYSHLEVRVPHTLSEKTTVLFHASQEEFYEIKPFRYLVEVEWRPDDWAAFSLLGMPEYDKRKADQGVSITLGRRPWNFLGSSNYFRICITTKRIFTTILIILLIQWKIIWKVHSAGIIGTPASVICLINLSNKFFRKMVLHSPIKAKTAAQFWIITMDTSSLQALAGAALKFTNVGKQQNPLKPHR